MSKSFTYKLCKDKITDKRYTDKKDMEYMLDTFHKVNRITKDEHTELTKLLNK